MRTQHTTSLVPFDSLILEDSCDVRGDVRDLAASIYGDGLREPLIVRSSDQGLIVVHGARRYLALAMLRDSEPECRRQYALVPVEVV